MAWKRAPLAPQQLKVLRWVADGCPEGVWQDDRHKQVARGLESRGLVSVRRVDKRWHAVLQPAGQYYLEHGGYPGENAELPVVTPAAQRVPRAQIRRTTSSTPRTREPSPPSPTVSDKLLAEILQAGGKLTLDVDDYDERQRLKARVRALRRPGRIPGGRQLAMESVGTKLVLSIEDLPAWMNQPVPTIQVPSQLRDPHPVVAKLRDSQHGLPVVGPARNRALRLLHALALAAEARGHQVRAGTEAGQRDPLSQLVFVVQGHEVVLRVVQLKDRSKHVPTQKELAEKQRWPWTRIPDHDYTPNEKLKVELSRWSEYFQTTWTDGVRRQIDEKLSEILYEIEHRANLVDRRKAREEEQRRLEKIEQQKRLDRANVLFVEAHRAEVLSQQMAAWERARRLDAYLQAMEARIAAMGDPAEAEAAREWLAWAREHAQRTDPLKQRLALPATPEPTYSELAPFLGGGAHRGFL
ncbi:hypothetical protein [Streptoalloteichus tenebrarius]|nr:hypothetical protein GCM10020241_25720 [Streptoalloteichus tenebrarius]